MPENDVIDLGVIAGGPGDGRSGGEPPEESPPNGIRRRPLLAGAVLLAASLTLTGSVRASRLRQRTLIEGAPDGSLTVDGERVFVLGTNPDPAAAEVEAVAYRLADGEVLWRTKVPAAEGHFTQLDAVGDTVVLIDQAMQGGDSSVMVLDAGTGSRGWTRSGNLRGWITGGSARAPSHLLVQTGRDAGGRPAATMTAFDGRTGAPVWTFAQQPGAQTDTRLNGADGLSLIVTGLPSGRVEVRDAVTARVLSAASVRPPVDARQSTSWLAVADDVVLIVGTDRKTLAAYDLGHLKRQWVTDWDEDQVDWYPTTTCAGVLCLSAAGRYRGVERTTGRLLWEEQWDYLQPAGDLLWGFRGDRGSGSEGPLALIDPATGRQRHDLGEWGVVRQTASDPAAVLVRRDNRSGKSWLAVLEPGARDVRVVGVLPDLTHGCVAIPGGVANLGGVACRTRDSAIGVWEYR